MPDQAFFSEGARARVTEAIRAIEAQTSAEVVVSMRRESGRYTATDVSFGAASAFCVLLVLLFHPTEFAIVTMPIEVALAFAVGWFVCTSAWPLRRLLTPKRVRREAVEIRARAVFHDMRLSRTAGRNAILVFVSVFEHDVAIVTDIGIDEVALGEPFARAKHAIETNIRAAADFDAFLEALGALGPALAATLPRGDDDQNELPDEPHVA
jgi:putative membrane protein